MFRHQVLNIMMLTVFHSTVVVYTTEFRKNTDVVVVLSRHRHSNSSFQSFADVIHPHIWEYGQNKHGNFCPDVVTWEYIVVMLEIICAYQYATYIIRGVYPPERLLLYSDAGGG